MPPCVAMHRKQLRKFGENLFQMFRPLTVGRRSFHIQKSKQGELPMFEKLEKLKHDLYVGEQKLRAAENEGKALQREMKKLNRAERTHRLCTRAGMLEAFLKEPTLLTDDDVMELLTFLFHGEAAQKKLDMLIENRRKARWADEG